MTNCSTVSRRMNFYAIQVMDFHRQKFLLLDRDDNLIGLASINENNGLFQVKVLDWAHYTIEKHILPSPNKSVAARDNLECAIA